MAILNHAYIGALVKRSQRGDSDAFAELYSMTYQHIFNYAGHYLRNPDAAQDAVQETYISALKNINKIKEPSLFVAWLNQICFHICYDMYKKKDGDYDLPSDELLDLVKDDKPNNNPEGRYTNIEDKNLIRNAILSLPINEQQVIVMRYFNDMKLDDIASAIGCSHSSVKRYLNSGREKIAIALRKEGFHA